MVKGTHEDQTYILMRVLIDTNILLISIPKASKYRLIFDRLIQGKYQLLISNSILSEYMEIIGQKTNSTIANNIGEFLLNSPHVTKIDVYYNWNLIKKDPDDNKFADCAIAGNAWLFRINCASYFGDIVPLPDG